MFKLRVITIEPLRSLFFNEPPLARENSAFDIEKIKMKTGVESAWTTDVFAPRRNNSSIVDDVDRANFETPKIIEDDESDISDIMNSESENEHFSITMSVEESPNVSKSVTFSLFHKSFFVSRKTF